MFVGAGAERMAADFLRFVILTMVLAPLFAAAGSAKAQPQIDPASDPIGALIARQGLDSAQSAPPIVIGLDVMEAPDRARLTIEISDPVEVKAFTLTAPNRVVLDMPEVLWRMQAEPRPSGRGPVRSYRYGQFRKGESRFVIDLNRPVKVEPVRVLPPEGGQSFRLQIDLSPSSAEEFAAKAGWPQDLSASAPAAMASLAPPPASAANGSRRTIVVDAGHGGIDPGTHGARGLQEKDLVLAVARRLKQSLEATGRYRVQLTRDADVFIPLRERVNIARAAHGDLLLSLHADSNESRGIRGASVYTLSEGGSDREAAKLAEKENMSDVIAGVDLSGENSPVASILIDLAQRDTMNRSARLAETVVAALPRATPVRATTPHRAAGFAVLKAPDVPAVLIELGYLTNEEDEAQMATEFWRRRVAEALTAALDRHFAAERPGANRQPRGQ
jgi:N-acetylmuramoyl-L-alanine amidase